MSRIVVVKVGGSLLDWPGLPVRLASYLETRRDDQLVLVVGGGRFADVLRDLDLTHTLGEARSHALALRVLDLSSHVLAELVEGLEVVEGLGRIPSSWAKRMVPILAPRRFLDEDDRRPDPLPHAWTTSTDSVAARVAVRLGAAELVLLKSVSIPRLGDPLEAARIGLVDPEFPRASMGVPVVTYINLRESE